MSIKNIGLVVVAGLVLLGVIGFFTFNGVVNDGNKQEASLGAAYRDNQNYLSDCIIRIRETAGVVKGQTAALDTVLTDAIKGRYDQGSTARGAVGGGAFISAVVEAYPDLKQLGTGFNKVVDVINGCRQDYRDKQSALLDRLRSYDSWRTGSLTTRLFASGYPSHNLVARFNNQVAYGPQAEEKMYQIVVVGDVNKDYQNGTVTPEDPFASPK